MQSTPPNVILTIVLVLQGDKSSPVIANGPHGYPAVYEGNWLEVILPVVVILGERPYNLNAEVEKGLEGALDAVQSALTNKGGLEPPEATVKSAPSRS